MSFKSLGFQQEERGNRIDSIPNSGTLTGNWGTDDQGCWWEYNLDIPEDNHLTAWIIGDYPEDYEKYIL